jgi:hypothetical protein
MWVSAAETETAISFAQNRRAGRSLAVYRNRSLAYKLVALALILIIAMLAACGKEEKTPAPTASPALTLTSTATPAPAPTTTPDGVEPPGQTSYDMTIDLLTSWTWAAQTFTVPVGGYIIEGASINIRKVGSPPDMLTVSIRATDSDGHPTGSDLTSGTISALSIGGSEGFIDVIFSSPCTLSSNTKYALVMYSSGESLSSFYSWWIRRSDVFPGGNLEQSVNSGSTWTSQPWDASFELYLAPTSLGQ